MADLLNVGTRALNAFQTAIDVTGNNIVNANTPGYSQQKANLVTEQGSSLTGNGVTIGTIERAYDQLLQAELITRKSAQSSSATAYQMSGQLESLFSEPYFGIQSSLDSYQAALNDLANNPLTRPERQVFLAEAENLTSQISVLGNAIKNIATDTNNRIEADINQINQLTGQLAELNAAIEDFPGNVNDPNGLFDQRDQLLGQLSEKLAINASYDASGTASVSLINGVSLVSGVAKTDLAANFDEYGTSLAISKQGQTGSIPLNALTAGGSLGGLIEFQQDILNPAMQDFGLLNLGIASASNYQQSLGLDLNGNLGANIFDLPAIEAKESSRNNGTATVNVDLTDYRQLESSDYELSFDGLNWTVTNLDSGASQTGLGPLSFEGMQITTLGSAVAGDSFLIQPAIDAIGDIKLSLSDPDAIAASAALYMEPDMNNQGSSLSSGLVLSDAASVPLASDIQLTFDPDALGIGVPGFVVSGIAGGPLAYDPATDADGQSFTLGDMQFEISGVPVSGDVHVISNNTGATGDNTNALAMADILDARALTSESRSIQDLNSIMLSFIGSKTAVAESSLEIESALLTTTEQSLQSITGVNLDEEASNLLRYQQAYQAAAQIISVAETLFDTLLSVTRR